MRLLSLALAAAFFASAALAGAPGSIENLKAHVTYLASDELEGREPGTPGFQSAADYVKRAFRKAGLKPGADGEWMQPVPLVMTRREFTTSSLDLIAPDGARRTLAELTDYIAAKPTDREAYDVKAPLVFAGYGVVDDETGYDDYGALDVTGKIVVVFAGAPKSFEGAKRAYLGSTDVKKKAAAARGALAILTVPTKVSEATSPFARAVERDQPGAAFIGLDGLAHAPAPEIAAAARMSAEGARALFAGARVSFDQLQAAEAEGGPVHAFEMPSQARLDGATRLKRIDSVNVVGLLEGSDPQLKDEVVIIGAHVDHIGKRKNAKPGEDAIRNGAMDNAVGVAMMIETASRLKKAKLRRSVVFVAFTGEEMGLLGSEYFAKNPPLGKKRIVGVVNLDMPLTLYPLGDVIGFGAERSSLGPLISEAAGGMGLTLTPDPYPEEGVFTRSDHFSFVVEQGVPGVFLLSGVKNGGEAIFRDFMKTHYHRPSDDLKLPIDWASTAAFADLNARIATRIANDDAPPQWNEGDYFGEKFGKK